MTRFIAAALAADVAMMLAGPGAEAVPDRCGRVKTCSQARMGCVRHCMRPDSPQCRLFCTGAFNDCMATGTFPSKFCGAIPGLIRR